MSYTIHVFSPQEKPLLKEQLRDELRRRGFEIAFCVNAYRIKEFASDEGAISTTSFEIIVGCDLKSKYVEQFNQVVQTRNVEALGEMLLAFQVYSCTISAQLPYDISDDWVEEEIEEFLENEEFEYVAALREARSEYTVQANIHFGGIDFASVVWRAIGELVGGMLEDGQEGILEFIPAH